MLPSMVKITRVGFTLSATCTRRYSLRLDSSAQQLCTSACAAECDLTQLAMKNMQSCKSAGGVIQGTLAWLMPEQEACP